MQNLYEKATSSKKNTIISLIIIFFIIAVPIGMFRHYHKTKFTQLPIVKTNQAAINNQLKNNNAKGLTYELVYQPGCKDCEKVQPKIIKKVAKLQRQHKLVVFNGQNKKTLAYIKTNEVTHTPTLLVKSHGYTVYSYAGDNVKTLTKLLNGIDPDNNEKFDTKSQMPAYMTTQNDFTGNKTSQAPVRHNHLEN